MRNEKEVPAILRRKIRMPQDVSEQIADFPSKEESKTICRALEVRIRNIFAAAGEEILDLTWRVKTDESIKEKTERKNSTEPIRDRFGLRVVARVRDRLDTAKMIQADFPLTPRFFANGFPSIREYADPKVRDLIKQNFNPNISDLHSALHVNIAFLTSDSSRLKIAEIQIMTPEELEVYHSTREGYKNGKR